MTLNNVAAFADQLGPAFNDLRPFARNLDELNASTAEARRPHHAGDQEPDPAVRALGPRSRSATCNRAANRLSKATPKLTVVGKKINRLGNMAAYNPNGAEASGRPEPRRGLPLLGGLARATTPTPSSRSRTRMASIAGST